MRKHSAVLSVSVKPDIKDRLQALAEQEHRNLSNYVSIILEQALAEMEKPHQPRN